MGLICVCVYGEQVVWGGYQPGLEKNSKAEGYAWTAGHNGQNKNNGNINGAEFMCGKKCLLCVYMFVLIVVDIYVPFLFKEIHPTVPYNFVSFMGSVSCHFGSLVPLTFTHSSSSWE